MNRIWRSDVKSPLHGLGFQEPGVAGYQDPYVCTVINRLFPRRSLQKQGTLIRLRPLSPTTQAGKQSSMKSFVVTFFIGHYFACHTWVQLNLTIIVTRYWPPTLTGQKKKSLTNHPNSPFITPPNICYEDCT